jgi:photosystem II stability/assembly factor-like uncharacterized protein
MIYSKYLGGSDDDNSNAIAVDSSGNVIIAGSTASTDFPTTANAIRRNCNKAADGSCLDAFVAKLNAAGSALVYSTYLGGTSDDDARGVALDPSGNAYVAGKTSSLDFPTTTSSFSNPSSGGFVTKLNPAGTMVYSTYCPSGQGAPLDVKGIAVNSAGSAFITGTEFVNGRPLAFVSSFTPAGMTGYFMGLSAGAVGNAIAVDSAGNAYVAGKTSSTDFLSPATAGVVQPAYGGGPIFHTPDGGSTWIPSGNVQLTSLYAIAVGTRGPAAAGPPVIYVGTDGLLSGVFESSDGGVNWNSRLANQPVHSLAADPLLVDTVYAGTRMSGVFKTMDGGISWSQTPLNNAFVTALAMADSNTIYAGTDANGIYKSTDAGATWTQVNNGLVTSTVNTIAIAATAPPTVYAGTAAGIYKTTDGGANWISASSGLFDPNVNALVVDSRNPHLIFTGTSSGIFRSLNDGAFWLASNSGLPSASAGTIVTAITKDPSAGTLYAAVGESNASRVFKSDSGVTWTPTSLASARVMGLAADASVSGSVYAATAGGSDAFVAKWDPNGTLVAWTYLGGYRDDSANAIALDATGGVYLAGDTSSTNFPIVNAIQSTFAGGSDVVTDAFVVKLNASLSAITYATYLGE